MLHSTEGKYCLASRYLHSTAHTRQILRSTERKIIGLLYTTKASYNNIFQRQWITTCALQIFTYRTKKWDGIEKCER